MYLSELLFIKKKNDLKCSCFFLFLFNSALLSFVFHLRVIVLLFVCLFVFCLLPFRVIVNDTLHIQSFGRIFFGAVFLLYENQQFQNGACISLKCLEPFLLKKYCIRKNIEFFKELMKRRSLVYLAPDQMLRDRGLRLSLQHCLEKYDCALFVVHSVRAYIFSVFVLRLQKQNYKNAVQYLQYITVECNIFLSIGLGSDWCALISA